MHLSEFEFHGFRLLQLTATSQQKNILMQDLGKYKTPKLIPQHFRWSQVMAANLKMQTIGGDHISSLVKIPIYHVNLLALLAGMANFLILP